MDTDTSHTLDVTATRVLDAPVEKVWQAWTDSVRLQGWWGPTGFTCPRADMDVRVGGRSHVTMRAPAEFGGMDFHNAWAYSAVVAPHRLEYVMSFVDEHGMPAPGAAPPGVPAEVPHVLILTPAGGGRTELTIVERGYLTEAARAMSSAGLEQCLDKLQALLAG